DELSTLPNVSGVAASMVELIAGNNFGNNLTVEGFQAGPDTDTRGNRNDIGPGYFKTLGIPLLAGREFTSADDQRAPKVAIVNEAFAGKFNLGRNPLGKHMKMGADNGNLNIEIVGFVRDTKYSGVKNERMPLFYLPYRQNTGL